VGRTIDSAKDPAFRAAAALAQARTRAAEGAYLIEGAKLLRQALAAGVLRWALVFDDHPELATELAAAGVETFSVAAGLAPKLIGTAYETRLEGVGVAERRPLASPPPAGLLLAAQAIADPRNVGVLVRSAEAAGCAALLLSDDSADPWSRSISRPTCRPPWSV